MSAPCWYTDSTTLIVKGANAEALKLFGYSAEEFIGLNASRLVAASDRPRLDAIRAAEIWGDAGSFTYIRKDGSAFSAHIRWHQGEYNGTLCDYMIVTRIGTDLCSEDESARRCHAPPISGARQVRLVCG
jgi:PAS domain S-box-containing protein